MISAIGKGGNPDVMAGVTEVGKLYIFHPNLWQHIFWKVICDALVSIALKYISIIYYLIWSYGSRASGLVLNYHILRYSIFR